jgi:hypothetical protein
MSEQPFTALAMQEADAGTPLEVPRPILFNTYKHHAGALRVRIASLAAAGPGALTVLAARIAVLGSKLMDLYTGSLSPHAICMHVIHDLHGAGRLDREAYHTWLAGQDGYAVVTLPDESRWVLRRGDEQDRYVHLHPGRWSPCTLRVRANVLKTAVVVLAHVSIFGGNPMDRALINAVRREHLGLSPLGREPESEAGLGTIIGVLRQDERAA